MLLKCKSYENWKGIAESLNLPGPTVENLSEKLDGMHDGDKRGFLCALAVWREKGAKRKESKKANWRNLKQLLSSYPNLTKAVNEIEKE